MSFKSGYIALLGAPNVGKSTLLNALLGEKLAIVSEKPQTTRHKLLGILNVKGGQLLFLDTPGLHQSEKLLNVYMMEEALATLSEADLVFFMVDPRPPSDEQKKFLSKIEEEKKPFFLIVNKIDRISKPDLLPLLESWTKVAKAKEYFLVSAAKGDGIQDLIAKALEVLPEGPRYYPEEELTDRDMRHLAA